MEVFSSLSSCLFTFYCSSRQLFSVISVEDELHAQLYLICLLHLIISNVIYPLHCQCQTLILACRSSLQPSSSFFWIYQSDYYPTAHDKQRSETWIWCLYARLSQIPSACVSKNTSKNKYTLSLEYFITYMWSQGQELTSMLFVVVVVVNYWMFLPLQASQSYETLWRE